MRILVVSNMYPSDKDPVFGTFVKTFVEEISTRNRDGITDLCVIRGRNVNKCKTLWKYIKFNVLALYYALFRRYDLIYIHCMTFSALPIHIASKFRNISYIINVHGGDVLTRSKLAEKLKKYNTPFLYNAKFIVSPSNFFKDVLQHNFPDLCPNKIFVSPSGGVNIKKFSPSISMPETFTIGFVSRIDEGKGWDILVEAAKKLRDISNVKFIMAGRGAQSQQLTTAITQNNLSDIVEYIGPVPYNQLPSLYRKFSVFVFPTMLEESLGLVAIEAMSCGVPIIGSNIGGLLDYIKDGENGYFFKSGDSSELIEKLICYMNLSSTKKEQMKENCIMTASLYESNRVFDELYHKIEQDIK